MWVLMFSRSFISLKDKKKIIKMTMILWLCWRQINTYCHHPVGLPQLTWTLKGLINNSEQKHNCSHPDFPQKLSSSFDEDSGENSAHCGSPLPRKAPRPCVNNSNVTRRIRTLMLQCQRLRKGPRKQCSLSYCYVAMSKQQKKIKYSHLFPLNTTEY